MSFGQPTKTTYGSPVEIWQTVLETAQGGFVIDASGAGVTDGDTLEAGTPIAFDESTRRAIVGTTSNAVKGLLYEDTVIKGDTDIAVVIRGTVYERRINGGVAVASGIKTKIPNIIFSQSF